MYPQAVRKNNRYRGPIESFKQNEMNLDMYKNIHDCYEAQNENMSLLNDLKDILVNDISYPHLLMEISNKTKYLKEVMIHG